MPRYHFVNLDRLEQLMAHMGTWQRVPGTEGEPRSPLNAVKVPLTSADLARLSGICEGQISRLRNGGGKLISTHTLTRLARALRVPEVALTHFDDSDWRYTSQEARVRLDELFDFMGRAERLISLTRNFFTHLLPAALHKRVEEDQLRALYPDSEALAKRLDRNAAVWEQQQVARRESNYLLKVLTPGATLDFAARANLEWVDEVARRMDRNWDNTAVGFVSDDGWRRIDGWIRKQVGVPDWVKVNVGDSVVACVYTHTQAFSTFYPPTVTALKELIEHRCAEELDGPFPATRLDETILRCTHRHAIKTIERRWLFLDGRRHVTVG